MLDLNALLQRCYDLETKPLEYKVDVLRTSRSQLHQVGTNITGRTAADSITSAVAATWEDGLPDTTTTTSG